jgi:hypothetical protein
MKKYLIALFTLIILSCGDEGDDPKPVEKTAYDLTDPSLKNKLENFMWFVSSTEQPSRFDTTNIVLRYTSSTDLSVNKTTVKKEGKFTYITLHKEFFDRVPAVDWMFMYLIHVAGDKEFDCIGPFRELKNNDDFEGFLIMMTNAKWRCHNCYPITYMLSDGEQPLPWDGSIHDFWLRDFRIADHKTYDFSELESLYQEAGIPICNK